MKEIVCKEKEIRSNNHESYLPKGYSSDNGSFGIFYIRKKGNAVNAAEIYVEDKKIKILDKVLYEPLRKFGNKHKYKTLMKCWKGAK